jgi:hypothetical protein
MAVLDTAAARQVLAESTALSSEELRAVATLLAESQGIGTCHRGDEPESLFLELTDDGLRYCCGHEPRHCSGYLDGGA